MVKWFTLTLLLWVAPAVASVVDRVAAVVDAYVVTRGEVDDHLAFQNDIIGGAPMDRHQALEELIEKALVEREAERRGLIPSDEELQAAVADIRARNKMNEEQFRRALESQGMDFDTYVRQVRDQMVQAKVAGVVVRERMDVGDEALREYYLKNVASYCDSSSLRLVHIEVPGEQARERAEELRSRVEQAGEPSAVGDQGRLTDMGYVLVENLSSDVRGALDGLPVGGVSPVVEMGGACNLFYVADRKEGRIRPFEEVRDQLKESYFRDKEEELFRRWLEDLKAQAHIVRKPEG
ncbi:MAG: SurA N-terminal domain-containing protein [Deferrisomatales bacterium]|nr:SurA N-terminal domain-containing protein [Deferrisomatales bacterium]